MFFATTSHFVMRKGEHFYSYKYSCQVDSSKLLHFTSLARLFPSAAPFKLTVAFTFSNKPSSMPQAISSSNQVCFWECCWAHGNDKKGYWEAALVAGQWIVLKTASNQAIANKGRCVLFGYLSLCTTSRRIWNTCIIVGWLTNPTHARSLLPRNFWSSYEYLIHE